MTKITRLSLILVFSLILSGCTLPGQSSAPVVENKSSDSVPSSSPSVASKSKLRDLLAKNQSLKCTMDYKTESADSTATVYISNGKSKIISNIKIEGGQTIESNMVVDGENLYTWQSGQSQGMKINVKNYASTGGNSQDTQGKAIDMDTEYDYNCQPWNGQDESFTPPSTIKFTQMGETLKKVQQNMQGVCDMLQDEAKQNCLDSMNSIPQDE